VNYRRKQEREDGKGMKARNCDRMRVEGWGLKYRQGRGGGIRNAEGEERKMEGGDKEGREVCRLART
jgi:hypothetical protein